MDQSLGRRVEEFFRAAGLLQLEVDVGGGLILGEGSEVEPHGDAVQQVGVQRLPQGLPQGFLAGQHDLQRRGIVQGRTDQQADVGQRLGSDQVSLIEDHQQAAFGLSGLAQDLLEESFLAATRELSQLAHQQFE